MKIVEEIAGLRHWRASLGSTERLGFVPTMGALHEGHLSLIHAAREACDLVAVSVFVNPTQFAPHEDFDRYPRPREADIEKAREAGVDLLWFGQEPELYPDGFATEVALPHLTRNLCAVRRPHHFGGVALVVLKLFNLVRPSRAYFGRKDYQQLVVVRRMARDLDLELEVVACPVVREPSGLACSSRNRALSDEGRRAAAVLYRALQSGERRCRAGESDGPAVIRAAAREILTEPRVELEYLELVDPDSLVPLERVEGAAVLAVAARVEGVRLIDNVEIGT